VLIWNLVVYLVFFLKITVDLSVCLFCLYVLDCLTRIEMIHISIHILSCHHFPCNMKEYYRFNIFIQKSYSQKCPVYIHVRGYDWTCSVSQNYSYIVHSSPLPSVAILVQTEVPDTPWPATSCSILWLGGLRHAEQALELILETKTWSLFHEVGFEQRILRHALHLCATDATMRSSRARCVAWFSQWPGLGWGP